MPRFLLALILLAAGSIQASAQDNVDCNNAMTQMEMTHCAGVDWQEADADLNVAYKSAMTAMRETDSYLPENLKGATDTLREAQRAWIPYRDKACEAYGFLARGGTLEPMLVLSCRADLTRQRTAELNELSKGFE
ncbi:hypothetical protein LP7551_05599 [Roseibium album]|nr:hypothetical protein LP7551_05599 [Roseibium album]